VSHGLLLNDQPTAHGRRIILGMPELDALLGGGVVPGSMLLIAGDPGIGKSTLLLQIAAKLATSGIRALYVSGEESGSQVRMRAERLGVDNSGTLFLAETNIESLLNQLNTINPGALIVDSVQTLYSEDGASSAGSVAQVKECTQTLLTWAKHTDIPIFLAGHVTKEGSIAGPRVLEHMVDVVMSMEGEIFSSSRVLHCTKNRFGSTNDLVMFEMRNDGLTEVIDPSVVLVGERQLGVPGSAIVVTLEGSRPLLAEIQGLTNRSSVSPPRRTTNGVDFNRMSMITAVLSRRANIPLWDQDIMVNVAGGLRLHEPAVDLATAMVIASSFYDAPLEPRTVFIGETGLNGEIRRIPQIEQRLREAARHGFNRAMIAKTSEASAKEVPDIELVLVSSLDEAFRSEIPYFRNRSRTK
jgi:DNA repair protein RadA/Sms